MPKRRSLSDEQFKCLRDNPPHLLIGTYLTRKKKFRFKLWKLKTATTTANAIEIGKHDDCIHENSHQKTSKTDQVN